MLDKQQTLQRTLAMSVKGLKTDNPMAGALTLAALSFLYGILHAVGPGHGKTIISSYVVANEETVRRGVIISFIAAGLQALTAVALVGLLLFGLERHRAPDQCLVKPARKRELCDDRYSRPLSPDRRSSIGYGAIGEASRRRTKLACKSLKATAGMVNTITPSTTIGTLTTMTTTITIITAIITRREKRAITSSMRGSLPGRYRGEKSWRWCSRWASGPAPEPSSCSCLR